MKAADINADTLLDVVAELQVVPHFNVFLGREMTGPANLSDLAQRLGAPEKVVLAKARRLVRAGRLTGCTCGCRGDFAVVAP
jgi:predicted transcriptional regulator